MHLTNFTFYSSIEIGISGRPRFLDLHNIYGWQSITYLPERRQIRMSWILPAGGQVQADLPPLVTLEFRGVSRFAASPHDLEMPYDEDTCLEAVTFTPPDHTSDKSEFKVFRNDSGHVAFLFRSGFGLKIWAEEAELIYDRDA
jgi:hypothetical protein